MIDEVNGAAQTTRWIGIQLRRERHQQS